MIAQEYLVPRTWGKSCRYLTHDDVLPGGVLRQEDEVSVQLIFDHQGQSLGCFTSRNVLKCGVPMLIDPHPSSEANEAEEVAMRMAQTLLDLGHIGPCNFQCKLTDQGPIFFEINPRFTGITAVRAAMGFNEVEAILRRMLFNEPIERVRRNLHFSTDRVCSRYITESFISRHELEAMRRHSFKDDRG
jgi:carbamoylphosphate synthase large subunit